MDNEMKEMLQQILSKVSSLDSKVSSLETEVKDLKTDMREIKRTVKKTAFQVDTLYDWVDGIDLAVKSNTDILDNLPLAK